MGAEQSALLVCTQTGKQEEPLKLINAEQFFQLSFDQMKEPRTGPVTEALLHLVLNKPRKTLEHAGNCWTQQLDQDSGYENDDVEMDELEATSDDDDVVVPELKTRFVAENVDLSSSDITITSNSNETNQPSNDFFDFKFVDLESIELPNAEEQMLEFNLEFAKRVADLGNDDL